MRHKGGVGVVNYLDLFSGIGGFALGAHMAGMKFEYHCFSEIEPYAVKVYKRRFPFAKSVGDIRYVRGAELARKYGENWIITGGFPCQDISIAGKGAGIRGAQSGLWFEMLRIIGELRPRFAIIENSARLLTGDDGEWLTTIFEGLAKIGYDAEGCCISAEDVGACHERVRLWIVAYSNGDSLRELQPQGCEQDKRRRAGNGTTKATYSESAKREFAGATRAGRTGFTNSAWRSHWLEVATRICRVDDGLPGRLDKYRRKRIAACGKAVVPHIPAMIFSRIQELLQLEDL